MTVFNQENVEDYYEIGDELGRYVMLFLWGGWACILKDGRGPLFFCYLFISVFGRFLTEMYLLSSGGALQ